MSRVVRLIKYYPAILCPSDAAPGQTSTSYSPHSRPEVREHCFSFAHLRAPSDDPGQRPSPSGPHLCIPGPFALVLEGLAGLPTLLFQPRV
eukprot:2162933-Pyramimonas_sp.AAC.1